MIVCGWLLKWFCGIKWIGVMYKCFGSCIGSEVGGDVDNIICRSILGGLIKIWDEIGWVKIKRLCVSGICGWIE